MAYVSINVDVDVDMSDFEDDDIREEFESRGLSLESRIQDILCDLYHRKSVGFDITAELNDVLAQAANRIL